MANGVICIATTMYIIINLAFLPYHTRVCHHHQLLLLLLLLAKKGYS
jgi:hypothetical protein